MLFLRRTHRLQWLVDQACFNAASLPRLEDCNLIRLLDDTERPGRAHCRRRELEGAGLTQSLAARRDDDSMVPLGGVRRPDRVEYSVAPSVEQPRTVASSSDGAPF